LAKVVAHRSYILAGVFVFSFAGCGGPQWEPFENLQLGQPIPPASKLPPEMLRDNLGLLYAEMVPKDTKGPVLATAIIMSALTGDDGRIGAKSYTYMSVAHHILLVTGEYRYILEMTIPEESFVEASKSWSPDNELGLLSKGSPPMMASLITEPRTNASDTTTITAQESSSGGKARLEPASPAEARARLRAQLVWWKQAMQKAKEQSTESGSWSDRAVRTLHALFSMPSVSQQDVDAQLNPKLSYPLRNINEYMLFNSILLAAATYNNETFRSRPDEGIGILLGVFKDCGHARLIELLSDPVPFCGVVRSGYKWNLRTWDGVNLRVSNLGNRRIRVEVSGCLVRDPVTFLLHNLR
jgi:hypothetical protein